MVNQERYFWFENYKEHSVSEQRYRRFSHCILTWAPSEAGHFSRDIPPHFLSALSLLNNEIEMPPPIKKNKVNTLQIQSKKNPLTCMDGRDPQKCSS